MRWKPDQSQRVDGLSAPLGELVENMARDNEKERERERKQDKRHTVLTERRDISDAWEMHGEGADSLPLTSKWRRDERSEYVTLPVKAMGCALLAMPGTEPSWMECMRLPACADAANNCDSHERAENKQVETISLFMTPLLFLAIVVGCCIAQ